MVDKLCKKPKNLIIHAHIHGISRDKAEIPNAKFWPDFAVFVIMDYLIIGLKVTADIPNIFVYRNSLYEIISN